MKMLPTVTHAVILYVIDKTAARCKFAMHILIFSLILRQAYSVECLADPICVDCQYRFVRLRSRLPKALFRLHHA